MYEEHLYAVSWETWNLLYVQYLGERSSLSAMGLMILLNENGPIHLGLKLWPASPQAVELLTRNQTLAYTEWKCSNIAAYCHNPGPGILQSVAGLQIEGQVAAA